MRVTNRGTVNTYMSGMQKNLNEMQKLNNQMNTQKVINKVSDDPYNAVKVMNMKTEIQDIERFNYNCDEIKGWLDVTDQSLDKIGTITTEIKTLLTSINDTYTQNEVNAVKKDVVEKIKELGESLNASYAGKYVFSGSTMDTKPITITENQDGTVKLDFTKGISMASNLYVEVSNGMTMDYNLNASEVLGANGLDVINDIVDTLNKDPFDVNDMINLKDKLDDFQKNILDCRATIGSKQKSVESIKNNNDTNLQTAKEVMSKIEDADIVEKYVELMTAQLAYNASVQVGSGLFQNTILDFIK